MPGPRTCRNKQLKIHVSGCVSAPIKSSGGVLWCLPRCHHVSVIIRSLITPMTTDSESTDVKHVYCKSSHDTHNTSCACAMQEGLGGRAAHDSDSQRSISLHPSPFVVQLSLAGSPYVQSLGTVGCASLMSWILTTCKNIGTHREQLNSKTQVST